MTPSPSHIVIREHPDHLHFALQARSASYHFHVDRDSGDLVHDHFGASIPGFTPPKEPVPQGWGGVLTEARREFPDHGRGDFRLPAIRVRGEGGRGHAISRLAYDCYEITHGKSNLNGLPATFGGEEDTETLSIHLKDKHAGLSVKLNYSVFPKYNAIARSFSLTNQGSQEVVLERAASFSVDMANEEADWDMVQLCGDWTKENRKERRKIQFGTQGFQSSTGYSSHYHNPFLGLVAPETSDTHGPAYGWSMIWTGSFAVDVEKFSHGRTRIMLGLNPLHLSYPLSKGETFQSPEVVGIFEPSQGLGGMSRSFHSLYRHHLSRSKWTNKDRPVLINNWEATYFDFDADSLYAFAKRAADLGVRLFVMDDGWFGVKKPRTSDHSGLGDWVPNPKRFPKGLDAFVKQVTSLKSKSNGSGGGGDSPNMKFGIWVEPEMVNRQSELYEKNPGWVLPCEGYERTEQRNQLVLDLGRTDVQDYIVESLSTILRGAPISYVKWDNNRGIHEIPLPYTPHKYMLGLYRVLHTLTDRFPDVLWEGCASGGGRFDPGLLHYWPQHWTSDDTDAYERLRIQFGTSLVYPPSSMGCHVSACPNEQVGRTTPLSFRAHVAMMGGSFGVELDLAHLNDEERKAIPGIVDLAERINPYVIRGDQYRLLLPEESNFPAVLYLNEQKDKAVVLAFQVRERGPKTPPPNLRLQGLEPDAWYEITEEGKDKGETETHSGATLLNVGVKFNWHGDYDSRVLWVTKTRAP